MVDKEKEQCLNAKSTMDSSHVLNSDGKETTKPLKASVFLFSVVWTLIVALDFFVQQEKHDPKAMNMV